MLILDTHTKLLETTWNATVSQHFVFQVIKMNPQQFSKDASKHSYYKQLGNYNSSKIDDLETDNSVSLNTIKSNIYYKNRLYYQSISVVPQKLIDAYYDRPGRRQRNNESDYQHVERMQEDQTMYNEACNKFRFRYYTNIIDFELLYNEIGIDDNGIRDDDTNTHDHDPEMKKEKQECDINKRIIDIVNKRFEKVNIGTTMCNWNKMTDVEAVLRLYCKEYGNEKGTKGFGLKNLIHYCEKVTKLNETEKLKCSNKQYFLYIDKTMAYYSKSARIGCCDNTLQIVEWF